MPSLLLAALAFIGLHLFLSATPLRAILVGRIGEGPYRGGFSLLSAGLLAWLILAYGAVTEPQVSAGPGLRYLALGLMAPAVALLVLGLLTPGPTVTGGERQLREGRPPRGIHQVTRHPFLWGVVLWAMAHLLVNPGWPHAVFFGTFALIAAAGTASIDAKRRRRFGADWERYAGQTSNLPFVAIARGSARWSAREVGAWRWLVTAAVFAALVLWHATLFGVPAW